MWIVKVKYQTGKGIFVFFFFFSFFYLNTLIILNKKFTIGVKWCLFIFKDFDFINFVKKFIKKLEPYPKF